MTDLPAYATGLLFTAVLCALAWWKVRDGALLRSFAAVAVIWAAGAAYVAETRIYDPWPLSMALDVMAAMVILRHPAGLFQALLGVLFMLQICMHIGYAAAKGNGGADIYFYYDSLTYAGWVQLMVLAGWASGRLGKDRIDRIRRRFTPAVGRAHHQHNRSEK